MAPQHGKGQRRPERGHEECTDHVARQVPAGDDQRVAHSNRQGHPGRGDQVAPSRRARHDRAHGEAHGRSCMTARPGGFADRPVGRDPVPRASSSEHHLQELRRRHAREENRDDRHCQTRLMAPARDDDDQSTQEGVDDRVADLNDQEEQRINDRPVEAHEPMQRGRVEPAPGRPRQGNDARENQPCQRECRSPKGGSRRTHAMHGRCRT